MLFKPDQQLLSLRSKLLLLGLQTEKQTKHNQYSYLQRLSVSQPKAAVARIHNYIIIITSAAAPLACHQTIVIVNIHTAFSGFYHYLRR